MLNVWPLALAGSLLLAAVHLLTPLLDRLPAKRQRLLESFSGGVGLTYVFLYLLFELTKNGSAKIHALLPLGPDALETTFMVLLFALVSAYLLFVQVERSASQRDDHAVLASFLTLYNGLAGAAMVEEARWGAIAVAVYAVALGLHLLFNDRHLHHMCPEAHRGAWRWGLGLAPLVGCGLALALNPAQGWLYLLLTLVAGFTVISVMRHELPQPAELHVPAFCVGVAAYALLLISTWRV